MDSTLEVNALDEALVRGGVYKLLAKSFLYPTSNVVEEIQRMHSSQVTDRADLEREYNRLFAHLGSAKCPPYETEYGHDNVFQKTQAMADIAGFYRAYGLEVSDHNADRVDFLGTELEFMAYLCLQEAYAREHHEDEHLEICLDTQRKFMKDHLGGWIGIFSKILEKSTENSFYSATNQRLLNFVGGEVERLGVSVLEVTGPNKEHEKASAPFGCDACSAASRQ